MPLVGGTACTSPNPLGQPLEGLRQLLELVLVFVGELDPAGGDTRRQAGHAAEPFAHTLRERRVDGRGAPRTLPCAGRARSGLGSTYGHSLGDDPPGEAAARS